MSRRKAIKSFQDDVAYLDDALGKLSDLVAEDRYPELTVLLSFCHKSLVSNRRTLKDILRELDA